MSIIHPVSHLLMPSPRGCRCPSAVEQVTGPAHCHLFTILNFAFFTEMVSSYCLCQPQQHGSAEMQMGWPSSWGHTSAWNSLGAPGKQNANEIFKAFFANQLKQSTLYFSLIGLTSQCTIPINSLFSMTWIHTTCMWNIQKLYGSLFSIFLGMIHIRSLKQHLHCRNIKNRQQGL